MLRVRDLNVNTRGYWNGVYEDRSRRVEYQEDKPFNYIRFQQAIDLVTDGWKVLDIACGVGNFTRRLKSQRPNCEVWGTDISDAMIEIDKKEDPNVKYLYQKIGNQTELPDNYFDFAFCGETLEHLDHPEDVFIDAQRVLKPGGIFAITTPYKDWVSSYEHIWSYELEDIEKLYIDNGFAKPNMERVEKEYFMTIFASGTKL